MRFRLGQSFSWTLHYFVYISTFPWQGHWLLFKFLAILVSPISIKPFIISELPLVSKLSSSSLKISKNYGLITIHFLVIIFSHWLFKFLLKNLLTLIFELQIPWIGLNPNRLAFLEISILNTHWWPISIPETSNRVEWGWMMPHDVFFLEIHKKLLTSTIYHMENDQTNKIWKQKYNSFPMRAYWLKSEKWLRNYSHSKVLNWEDEVRQKFQSYSAKPSP